jgi:uncharacterized protein
MAAYFFDTSGIVKRYIQEPGTAWVRALADPRASHEIFLARITIVEVTSAVIRRGRGGTLPGQSATVILNQFRQNLAHQYNLLGITDGLLDRATRLAETYGLRAYDAVQLAVSLELHSQRISSGLSAITLVSADQELNVAAITEGLVVEDPNQYP